MSAPDTIYHIITNKYYVIKDSDTVAVAGKVIINRMAENPLSPAMGIGALMIGIVLGWNLYFINRYRKRESIDIENLGVLITALLGAGILGYFDQSMKLMGYYGTGLGIGFFMYLWFLIRLSKDQRIDPKYDEYRYPIFFLKSPDGTTTRKIETSI